MSLGRLRVWSLGPRSLSVGYSRRGGLESSPDREQTFERSGCVGEASDSYSHHASPIVPSIPISLRPVDGPRHPKGSESILVPARHLILTKARNQVCVGKYHLNCGAFSDLRILILECIGTRGTPCRLSTFANSSRSVLTSSIAMTHGAGSFMDLR